jgi:predicted SAM-dependent methyltransferase
MNEETTKILRQRAEVFLSNRPLPYKLNLGGGQDKKEGFINIDIIPMMDSIIWDLEIYPWPFSNDSVNQIHCSHLIEHISDIIGFMNELYRICKEGAIIYIEAPYYSHIMAMQDPTHKRFISEMSFLYFDKNWRKTAGLAYYPIRSDFRVKKIQFGWDKRLIDATEEEKQFARDHYLNAIATIGVYLQCFKGEEKKEEE